MKNWRQTLVSENTTIMRTLQVIDDAQTQIALVVDEHERLLGTVTDGDVRRGILRGLSMDRPVTEVMNSKPTVSRSKASREELLVQLKRMRLRRIPILDDKGRVTAVVALDDVLIPDARENMVVIMAGGLGERLRPLTENCPKPMLKIGEKPVLEHILNNFRDYGFHEFFFSVNYMADMIKDHFGDGSDWGVSIKYLHEDKRLGTGGALSLLPHRPDKSFVVMNGDLMTKINLQHLFDFHREHKAMATMCIRQYDFQVPFGVVNINGSNITSIDEKPVQKFLVNAGIYLLEPATLDLIPDDTFIDMPDLFNKLVENKAETAVFPLREYWLDIGYLDDLERAKGEFKKVEE